MWTENMPENLSGDILIIPGGKGARRLVRYEADILDLDIAMLVTHALGYDWDPEEEEGIFR